LAKQPVADWGDFESAEDLPARSIIWAGEGIGGSGKTHFACTAPDPIAYFLFEPGGLKGVLSNPESKGKDIRVIDFSKFMNWGLMERAERVKRAGEVMAKFYENWNRIVKLARTAVIDKEDMFWETMRYAHDEVDSPDPKSFYELNLDYAALVADAEAHSMNLALLRGMKEKWGKTVSSTGKVGQGFTGEVVPRGQKQVTELVQINLAHRWDDEAREFKVKILDKCRLGNAKEIMGEEFADFRFMDLATLLYPDSSEDEWRA
jgi:hypothetical protein